MVGREISFSEGPQPPGVQEPCRWTAVVGHRARILLHAHITRADGRIVDRGVELLYSGAVGNQPYLVCVQPNPSSPTNPKLLIAPISSQAGSAFKVDHTALVDIFKVRMMQAHPYVFKRED